MYTSVVKRLLDVIWALGILAVTSPLLLLIAIAIRLDSKGPVIFSQKRLGRNGKEFTMYKFRTMFPNAEAAGVYSDGTDPRVTRVGRYLRKTSLDELPQCVNILKGDMSFIGFRPPLTYHPWPWEEYTEAQRAIFALRPGITGWAQVNGRKALSWDRRIALNVWYTEHVSFSLDCRIFLMTICRVITNSNNENVGFSFAGERKNRHGTQLRNQDGEIA